MEAGRLRVSKRAWWIAGGVVLALVVLAYGWGFQVGTMWNVRRAAKRNPVLWITPKPLPQTEVNRAQGMELTNDGVTFEVPWDDMRWPQTIDKFSTNATFTFESGVVLMCSGPNDDGKEMVSDVSRMSGGPVIAENLYGKKAMSSDYDFQKEMLEAVPGMVKPWSSRRDAARLGVLMLMKAIVSDRGAQTGIFSVEANGWKGFQLGDPARKARVMLDLYDAQERKIEIIFSVKDEDALELQQADINRVIQTIHLVAPESGKN